MLRKTDYLPPHWSFFPGCGFDRHGLAPTTKRLDGSEPGFEACRQAAHEGRPLGVIGLRAVVGTLTTGLPGL